MCFSLFPVPDVTRGTAVTLINSVSVDKAAVSGSSRAGPRTAGRVACSPRPWVCGLGLASGSVHSRASSRASERPLAPVRALLCRTPSHPRALAARFASGLTLRS